MLLECHKQQHHILVVATHAHLMRDLVEQLHVSRTPLTEFGQQGRPAPGNKAIVLLVCN